MDLPALDRREDGAERGIGGAHHLGVELVPLEPLQEDAAGAQALRHRLVELLAEQAGDAGPVGVRGLGEDEVVARRRGEQDLAPVADHQVDLGIVEHVLVDPGADARRRAGWPARARRRPPAPSTAPWPASRPCCRCRGRSPAPAAGWDGRGRRRGRSSPGSARRRGRCRRLAVDDEGVLLAEVERDGALDAVRLPDDARGACSLPGCGRRSARSSPATRTRPAPIGVWRQKAVGPVAVQNRSPRTPGGDRQRRGARRGAAGAQTGRRPPRAARARRRSATSRQTPGAVSRGIRPKPPASEPSDRAQGVRGVGDADLAADPPAAGAEQGDQQRELVAGDDRGRQHDERRHRRPGRPPGQRSRRRPAGAAARPAPPPGRPGEGEGDQQRLQGAGGGEGEHRRPPARSLRRRRAGRRGRCPAAPRRGSARRCRTSRRGAARACGTRPAPSAGRRSRPAPRRAAPARRADRRRRLLGASAASELRRHRRRPRASAGISRARLRAASTTRRLSRAAIQIVLRIPSVSSAKKVVSRAPSTAPRVLTA